MNMSGRLVFYTVYEKPLDHPEHWVVRAWYLVPGTSEPIPDPRPLLANTLEDARKLVPAELYNLGRFHEDDPFIVETWV